MSNIKTLRNAATTVAVLALSNIVSANSGSGTYFGLAAAANASTQNGFDQLKPSFYTHFQWRDTQTDGDGFSVRRARFGLTYSPLESTSAKISVDLSTGGDRLDAKLKDLIITHKFTGKTSVAVGQQSLPLGYEIERSSSSREMPERSLYNRRLFAGERDRGVQVKHELGSDWLLHAGIWSGLTLSDPQQNGFRDQDMKPAFTLGVRKEAANFAYGISAFLGSRPAIGDRGGARSTDRFLIYLHGMSSLAESLIVRAEVMTGTERDPLGGENPVFEDETSVLGYHVQLSYFATPTSQFTVKYESYDPDTNDVVSNDRTISQFGLAYTHHLNKALKFTLSWEHPDEQGSEQRNDIITFRSQFKI